MEIWKDIEGYEGSYQVSNLGNVKSIRTGKILAKEVSKGGYIRVHLFKKQKGKHFLLHRLVAQAFISNDNNLPVVNHKDEDKTNNNYENLEWCTSYYNANYGTRNSRIAKRVICKDTGEVFESIRQASIQKNIEGSNISECCLGKRKTAGGLEWCYDRKFNLV